MTTDILAAEGAELVKQLELHIENSIATAAEMTAYLTRARRESGVSPTFGQQMFEHSSETLALLVQSRKASVQLHHSAHAATKLLGLKMAGPNQPKPDQQPEPTITLVRSADAA
jgi:hypothetical protein